MKRIVFLTCILIAGQALAKEKINCQSALTQIEMNVCAAQDFEEADTELNTVWKLAKAEAERMDAGLPEFKGASDSLLAAQRGWIAYRDGTCDLAGWEARGGSMESMLVSGCLAQETRKRTKQLEEFLEGSTR